MAYIGPAPNPGQNREVDDISGSFNGSNTAFTLQVNSQNVSPGSSNAIVVSLGGVVQDPGTDYTVAASTLSFTTAPASGLSFFGLVLGQGIDTTQVADASVTNAKVSGSAAIAGTKISPDFGSQNVVTTGTLGSGALSVNTGTSNTCAIISAPLVIRSVPSAPANEIVPKKSPSLTMVVPPTEDALDLPSDKNGPPVLAEFLVIDNDAAASVASI